MKNSYGICILTAFVFLNTMRTEQQSRKGANDVHINLIGLSNLTFKFNAILTEFIIGFGKQQKLRSRQIVFEKVTNRHIVFDEKSLSIEPSKLFDCAKSKARCFTGLTCLSVSSEEDQDDTTSELLVYLLNKIVENLRSYGDNDYDLVYRNDAQTEFSISFDNLGKSVVFLGFQQFLKEGCVSSFMNLNIAAHLESCDISCNQTFISEGFRK